MKKVNLLSMVLILFSAIACAATAKEIKADIAPPKEIIIDRVDILEIQVIAKDVNILTLQSRVAISQKSQELNETISDIKTKYDVPSGWEISRDGTKFIAPKPGPEK